MNGELKENNPAFIQQFTQRFDTAENSFINESVSNADIGDKKSGIFAIVCLIDADSNVADLRRVTRFSNYLLRGALKSSDQVGESRKLKHWLLEGVTNSGFIDGDGVGGKGDCLCGHVLEALCRRIGGSITESSIRVVAGKREIRQSQICCRKLLHFLFPLSDKVITVRRRIAGPSDQRTCSFDPHILLPKGQQVLR